MKTMGTRCATLLLGLAVLLQLRMIRTASPQQYEGPGANEGPERGDVPGWVMITLMSAVLVAALLALAGPALEAMFNQAMDKVGN